MLDRFVSLFFSIPGPWVVGAVFLLSAAETALFVGFVIPGELAVILGGVLASPGVIFFVKRARGRRGGK